MAQEMGQWFADYMMDAGYVIEDSPIMHKQMIMKAFPRINPSGQEITTDNAEQVILNYSRLLNNYWNEKEHPAFKKALVGRFGSGSFTSHGSALF